eukprot:TRINITY_DN560_c2_g1_i2.p2 TRINITY_DN560_c2_g1~~TRINITY_DN560_c2_g1_i2.p2  ORF type:complete len:134 (+),score=22.75 TRINITY_DN560_c2_g1_i2:455-856(+)
MSGDTLARCVFTRFSFLLFCVLAFPTVQTEVKVTSKRNEKNKGKASRHTHKAHGKTQKKKKKMPRKKTTTTKALAYFASVQTEVEGAKKKKTNKYTHTPDYLPSVGSKPSRKEEPKKEKKKKAKYEEKKTKQK